MMYDMDTSAHKQRLLEEKDRLEKELSAIGRKNPLNPSDWEPLPPSRVEAEADPVDVADYSTGYDTNASIVADLESRYNVVVAALSRIENGTYGTCAEGEHSIEESRLEADPAAGTCLAHLHP